MLTIVEFKKGTYGTPSLTWDCARPLRFVVFGVTEAAAFPARLALQPEARTLHAFFTTVSPAALAQKPRRCTLERPSKCARPLRREALPPRTEKMAVDWDWPSFTLLQHHLNPWQYLFLIKLVIQCPWQRREI